MGSGLPRPLDAALAAGVLLVVSPVLLAAGAAVLLSSGLPVIFRQQRVGRGGENFTLFKFRTMVVSDSGPAVTAADDRRITRVGRILRRTKVDELPELWNVVRGDMALVGPRPEAPRYVRLEDPRWQQVLAVRPGLTDPTTLSLLDEEAILQNVEGDREAYYVEQLLPRKLDHCIAYLGERSWRSDLEVIWRTVAALVQRVGGRSGAA